MADSAYEFALTLVSQLAKPPVLDRKLKAHDSAGQGDVRRPLDSLRVLPDTYATLAVRVRSSNTRVQLHNTSATGGKSFYTANMLLQSVSTTVTEKMQLTQTFDDDRLFFFGKNLDTLNVRAILIENESFQWAQEWYENYLRATGGTASAERGAEAELRIEERRYYGYLTQFNMEVSSNDRHMTNLSFAFTVTRTVELRELHHEFPIAAQQTAGDTITAALSQAARETALGSSAGIQTSLSDVVQRGINTLNARLTPGSVERKGSTREAFPAEFPNNAQGYAVDQVRDIQISAAIAARVATPSYTPLDTVVSLLADGRDEEARLLLLGGVVQPRATLLRAQGRRDEDVAAVRDNRTFDRYVGLIPASTSIAAFQARQVALGLADIALSSLTNAAAGAALGADKSFADAFAANLISRAGMPQIDNSFVPD